MASLRVPIAVRGRAWLLDAALLSAWLACVGLVILHERGHWGRGAVQPAHTLRATLDVEEQWFGLYYQGRKIGYAWTMLSPREWNGIPGMALVDRGHLTFSLLGEPQQLDLTMEAFLDADLKLQTFDAQLQTNTSRLHWSGQRAGDVLLLTAQTDGAPRTARLRDPRGQMLVTGLAPWSAFRQLAVGQWGRFAILNPLALQPEEVLFHVRGQETVQGQAALVIDTTIHGLTTTSWVTPTGEVLREQSPLGWELVREAQEQAVQLAADIPPLDLLSTTAVPFNRSVASPERVTRLVCLVQGISAEALSLQRPWQRLLPPERLAAYRVESPQGAWCLLELTRAAAPDPAAPGAMDPALDRYRRPSPFVPSDHPLIRARAAAIAGSQAAPWPRALAINQWVHSTLTKRLTVGLPSALDVLHSLSGDCHEHTLLFTALARSAGLPTRMTAGLAYYGGQLYYHAWPEVWVGGWVPMDPTLGQPIADALHLGLVEAEAETLIALGQFVGQLRLDVLELEEEAPVAGPS
jgi:transglutaminase-like putative cysteine protease